MDLLASMSSATELPVRQPVTVLAGHRPRTTAIAISLSAIALCFLSRRGIRRAGASSRSTDMKLHQTHGPAEHECHTHPHTHQPVPALLQRRAVGPVPPRHSLRPAAPLLATPDELPE